MSELWHWRRTSASGIIVEDVSAGHKQKSRAANACVEDVMGCVALASALTSTHLSDQQLTDLRKQLRKCVKETSYEVV